MALPPEQYIIRDVTNPRGVVRALRDHWWWCIDGEPSKAVFYIGRGRGLRVGSPQCNSNRAITERIPVPFERASIYQIPVAFVPVED